MRCTRCWSKNSTALSGREETVAGLDQWFGDAKVRAEVSAILSDYKLDNSVIEATAFRLCVSELTLIEQLLASAEARRDRALHAIAFYRQSLAQRLREHATHMIQNADFAPRSEEIVGHQK